MEADRINGMEQTTFAHFISPLNRQILFAIAESVDLKPGEYLFREGQENHRVFALCDGQIDLCMTVPGRGPTRILSLGAGDLVAWSAVLGGGVMTSSAICIEPTRLTALDSRQLLELIASNPSLGSEFMTMMATALSKRLLATRLQMLDLFASND